jgi:ABC-type nitrate/sulfonate/bicarbonate transport system permease component
MRDVRHVARQRWRETNRRRATRDTAQRFGSAFFFGVVLATLAAIVIGSFKQ